MASLIKDGESGRWRIAFTTPDRKRRAIWLGAMPKKMAVNVKARVEILIAAGTAGEPLDAETIRWAQTLPSDLRDKLARAGLVEARAQATVGGYTDSYIEKRTDVTPGSITALRQAQRSMEQFFGRDKRLGAITEEDARDFRIWLQSKTGGRLAEATASRRCRWAKHFLESARRAKLVPSNVFDGVKMGSQKNANRLHYVPPEVIDKVLDYCPNDRWRLIIVLARYAALRCPSELVHLRWGSINWAERRMSVFSPKTNTTRIVPIFPRVRPYLDKLFFEPTEKPADLVFPGLDSAANLRTMFRKIIMQSGQEAWPRLFQNLRASGATDIANMVRSHTAAAWCGHSEVIALQHYRQVIEEDFVKVTEEPAGTGPAGVAQNPARMGTVLGGMGPGEKPQYPCFPESCGPMPLLNTCSPNLDGSESPRTDSRASPSQPD